MALPGVVVKLAGEAKGAITAIDSVGDELKKLPGAAAGAAQGVGRHASDMSRDLRRTGTDTETTGRKMRGAYDTMGDSAAGAASQIGEAFGSGGSVASSLGGLGEVVESVAGMFGPVGLAVAAAGGVALGALSGLLGKSEEKLEELKQKASSVVDELIAKKGELDAAYAETAMQEFTKDNLEAVEAVRRLAGPQGLVMLQGALAGSAHDYGELTEEMDRGRRALVDEQDELNRRYAAGERLTDSQIRRMNTISDEIGLIDDARDALGKEVGAVDRAYRTYDLLETARLAQKSALEGGYDAMLKQTQLLYDEATAAAVARDNIRRLQEQESKRSARGEAPANAVAYFEGKGWVDKSGKVVGRQQGGQVEAGHAYLVGESGPETFVPATGGTIVPATAAAPSVTVHLHMAVATPAVIREAGPIVAAAVADGVRRGGTPALNRVYGAA